MTSVNEPVAVDRADLETRAACEALFQEFGACVDEERATDAIGLFAEDATLEAAGRRYRGREEILGFLRQREVRTGRHTRHVGANFRFRRLSADAAQARALLLVFAGEAPAALATTPDVISDCELTFARHADAGWLVTSRRHTRIAQSEQPA